jgi:predicted nucleotidyltransferase component of viral defense system
MNKAISVMLKKYGPIRDRTDEENALKEILQYITLLGLHRAGFFDKAAFYGGTALRMLYDLDRFSEDMDFCLEEKDPSFSFKEYLSSLTSELELYGFNTHIEEKRSGLDVAINSAFVKQDTYSALLLIGRGTKGIHKNQLLKVKLEIDKENPSGAKFCQKLVPLPVPFMVKSLDEASLFAGKLHAVIARSYVNRVKGRDYYDLLFYSARGTRVNLQYLEAKLRNSNHYTEPYPLSLEDLITLLCNKFEVVDFNKAKEDVSPFLKPEQRRDLMNWGSELFSALVQGLQVQEY